MGTTAVQLWGGLLEVGGAEVRVRRSLALRYRGTVRWMRNADGFGSALTRAVLATSALWTSVTMAPDVLDALSALNGLSLASLRAAASVTGLVATFAIVLTVVTVARKMVADHVVPTPAIDRVEVADDDRELTIVYQRDGRWFSGTRERTLRPVSEDALAEATASFRSRGVAVEPGTD